MNHQINHTVTTIFVSLHCLSSSFSTLILLVGSSVGCITYTVLVETLNDAQSITVYHLHVSILFTSFRLCKCTVYLNRIL